VEKPDERKKHHHREHRGLNCDKKNKKLCGKKILGWSCVGSVV
jgi:hypothetical protein